MTGLIQTRKSNDNFIEAVSDLHKGIINLRESITKVILQERNRFFKGTDNNSEALTSVTGVVSQTTPILGCAETKTNEPQSFHNAEIKTENKLPAKQLTTSPDLVFAKQKAFVESLKAKFSSSDDAVAAFSPTNS